MHVDYKILHKINQLQRTFGICVSVYMLLVSADYANLSATKVFYHLSTARFSFTFCSSTVLVQSLCPHQCTSTLLPAQHQTAGRQSDQACGEERLAAKQADISP